MSTIALDHHTLAPGQKIQITEHSSFVGRLYVSLSVPDLGVSELDLQLLWCFLHGETYCCLLVHPAAATDDEPKTYVMVLKVAGPDQLETLNEIEFQQVEDMSRAVMASRSHVVEADISVLLGAFPEVEI